MPSRRPISAGMVIIFFWVTVVIMKCMITLDRVDVKEPSEFKLSVSPLFPDSKPATAPGSRR